MRWDWVRSVRPTSAIVGAIVVLGAGALVVVRSSTDHRVTAATTPLEPLTGTTHAYVPPAASSSSSPPPNSTSSTTPSPAALRLAARLDAIVAGTNSCLVVADNSLGPDPIYQHQPQTALAPASTQKLVLAAAALSVLGPDFRFVTKVVAPAPPVSGRVDNLWLVGSGDALLATPEYMAYTARQVRVVNYPWTPLASLVDGLTASGIRSVPGGIRGDDSHHEPSRWIPAWPQSYRSDEQIGLLSALTINQGLQTWTPRVVLATDPPAFASAELSRLASGRGIAVGAPAADQKAPSNGVVVAQVESAPLGQIVSAMLRASDNLIAELLVRELDRTGGTTAGGLSAVADRATALGVPMTGAVMLDGSGLAPGDRATCPELLAALRLGSRPGLSAIVDGLPLAGVSGTLANRFRGSPIAGKLWAKTGSIDNAGGIVGSLKLTRPVEFSLVINQPMSYGQLVAKEDEVIGALATYPEGP